MSNNNIYLRMEKSNLLVIVIYVDDIIFGYNNDESSHKFAQEMSKEFEMSNDWRANFLPWTSNHPITERNVYYSVQIPKLYTQKVWNG